MNKLSERISYLDIAKGFLILFLTISHFNSATRLIGIENKWFAIIYLWTPYIACFFMQCFFMISGYCSNFKTEFSIFIKKQFRQILIPLFCFEIIGKLLGSLYYKEFTTSYFLSSIISPPNTSLWFFIALFFSKLYLWYMLKQKYSIKAILLCSLVMLFLALLINQYNIGYNIFAIRNSLAACFFVTCGYFIKKIDKGTYERVLKMGIIIFPITIIILKIFNLQLPVLDAGVSNVGWIYLPIILIVTLSGSFACLFICKKIGKCKFFEYFGRNSIIVYGLHFIPLMSLIDYYYHLIMPYNLLTMLITIILIYVTLLFTLYCIIKLFHTPIFKWIIGE